MMPVLTHLYQHMRVSAQSPWSPLSRFAVMALSGGGTGAVEACLAALQSLHGATKGEVAKVGRATLPSLTPKAKH